jgi:hypothetical protein
MRRGICDPEREAVGGGGMLGRSLVLPIGELSCINFLTANIIGVAPDLTT